VSDVGRDAGRAGDWAGLSADAVRRFYDRFGRKQDLQVYEGPPLDELVRHAGFDVASHVFELGCGTGRFAERLLDLELSWTADYHGVDVSETMVQLAGERLKRFGSRAKVERVEADADLATLAAGCDRFVVNYVLDLLPEPEIHRVLGEAVQGLAPGGRLCAVSLSHGVDGLARAVSHRWERVFLEHPEWVGGCRPIALEALVRQTGQWRVLYAGRVRAWLITSEVVVATPASPEAA
jgi:ubiquinone/menaquinone biosynthesis C-methylase UbiE